MKRVSRCACHPFVLHPSAFILPSVIILVRLSKFKGRRMPANFQDLVALMARLRSPEGCPWDREQTYATLAPMLLEEAYEAFEAVEAAREGRPANLCEELGDLLFQIIFYAQVAAERSEEHTSELQSLA